MRNVGIIFQNPSIWSVKHYAHWPCDIQRPVHRENRIRVKPETSETQVKVRFTVQDARHGFLFEKLLIAVVNSCQIK